ncbi:MAG: AzlD domain-containing protein [Clostridia bacterium]|nr:AzlD domain-containing protein [Clostridia bacterium]
MNENNFWIYLLVMAGITYMIRMIPLVLIKRKIKNKFILSFLYYIPYTVLSVMTIPAIFCSTSSTLSAFAGFLAAVILAYFGKSLLKVAASSCAVVFAVEFLISIL